MIDFGTYTVKDMLNKMADRGESDPPTQTIYKRTRKRKKSSG